MVWHRDQIRDEVGDGSVVFYSGQMYFKRGMK